NDIGPTTRQWALVHNQAKDCADLPTLITRLFDEKTGICKPIGEREGVRVDWDVEGSYEGKILSFAQWLKVQIDELQFDKLKVDKLKIDDQKATERPPTLVIEIVAQLAHRMRRSLSGT
ncbi:MAG: hypothetical protein P8104_07650, partial [Gammaproteobacteria bacterium]